MSERDVEQPDLLGGIAIIGMAGRFPGAKTIEEFWRNLCAGVESVSRFKDSELEDSFSPEVRAQDNFIKARPILNDVDQFDAEFFGMYAREAELTDPQHRLFLECSWEALESAGYDPATFRGLIGVFAGSSINTYFLNNVCGERRTIEEFTRNYQVGSYPMLLGAGLDFLATRVSYKLDLRGPSFTLQTACSTSLLAVAQACQSLRLYQADMALAGGVSITFPQKRGYQHLEGGMVSADGTCRPFDADATGTIFGSGAGVVLLKRLEDAVADRDHIYAVIRGSGVNNDGASKVGFTAPSVEGQAAVIEMALADAGVDARSVSYVECHGTATPLGDPIEVAGLTKAFAAGTADLHFCALGSVKGNVGHLDAAAGVTGLIKTALALKHETLPPSLHYRRPNPQIDFDRTPFFVNAELTPWPRASAPRRAGVSAFGVGGTNVHVVLEQAPESLGAPLESGSQVIALSARSAPALAVARRNFADHLRTHPEESLADAAYTLQIGRRHFDHRMSVVVSDRDDALAKLDTGMGMGTAAGTGTGVAAGAPTIAAGAATSVPPGAAPDAGAPAPFAVHTGVPIAKGAAVVFMFPGQGAQYPDMGRELFERESGFRRSIERCAAILDPLMVDSLLGLLYPATRSPETEQRLMSTVAAQPAIFSVEFALAQLWMSWGITPHAMIGHSVGELVAATLAGVFTLEDALTLVAARGRLMHGLPGGAMLAVRLSEPEVLPLLNSSLAIAAINGPALCVVSGPYEAIDDLEQVLASRNVASRRLHTSHAFHSPMIDPVVAPLRKQLEGMTLSAPGIRYVSCVTGDWIRAEQATSPDYWASHARNPVRFGDGILKISESPASLLLEVGPGNVLSTLALQATRGRGVPVVTSMQDALRQRDDRDCLLDALGRTWVYGARPDWTATHGGVARSRLPLPTYPFQRSRHWIDAPAVGAPAITAAPVAAAALVAAAAPATTSVAATMAAPAPPAPISAVACEVPAGRAVSSQDHSRMNENLMNNRLAEIGAAVAAIFEDLSGTAPESIDAPTTFLEMGYDSLFLTQVAQKIQSQMKVKITFRQLLGELSTIPSLTRFLVAALPMPAAVRVTAPPPPAPPALTPGSLALTSGSPALTPGSAASQPGSSAAPTGMEGIFRDQLQAMSQLINRQFEVLQGMGTAPSAPAGFAAPAAPASVATPAAPAALAPAALDESGTPAEAQRPGEAQRPSRFEVFVPSQKPADTGITAAQRRHIDALVARYTKKTAGSQSLTQAHRAVLADPRAAAGFRAEWKDMVYPIVCASSSGSKLYDVDGNEYIDLVNGFGQTAFGHAPAFVVDAVKAQLDLGFAIGPQAELACDVAALFCEMTGNDRMTFCNTGSEAVMAAMRIARTVTGREKIVIFNGDYHGQFDEVLVKGVQRAGAAPRSIPVAPGIPATSVGNMIVLEYGSPQSLAWIRDNAEDLAAVIAEPVQSRHPNLQPFEFLREIRRITEASGTAFVMDEVVTGFRVHPGGMQAVIGIRADLAAYGKVVGGGMPVGILAGNTKFMDALDGGQWRFGDDSFPEVGVTFFAGTFVRHPLVLAAIWAVLNHLKHHGPSLQENLSRRTAALVIRLRELFSSHGLATQIESYSSWFYFHFHSEHPLAALYFYHLRERGIHIQDGFPCFLTTAHSEADFERIYDAFRDSLEELQSVGILGARQVPAGAAAAAAAAAVALEVSTPADGPVPLTESQLEIWLSAQLSDEASCAFNESVSLELRGVLDTDALEKALNRVIARHDALRATFTATGEAMHIQPTLTLLCPLVDLSTASPAQAVLDVAALLDADARTAFDLVNGPCIRAQLVRRAADSHTFVFTAHHIICDGWSINVIVSELAEIYAGLCGGPAPQLAEALQFSAYARAQGQRDPDEVAATERFWLEQFAQTPQALELPTDRPRPALKSFSGASHCRRIDATLYQAVRKSGARQGSTLFVTLLAAFQALMGRFAGQNEVVVGVPTAGQTLLEDQLLVGHCVNFLPIRGAWTRETRVGEYLSASAKRILDAYEHQDYTFGTLVRKLALPREPGRLPLAEIQFNLERLADRIELPGLSIDVTPNAKAHVNFDLFLNVIESAAGLRLDCDYNTDLFDESTIAHWLDCYEALLESIVADAAQPLSSACCLPPAERDMLARVNDTAAEYPREHTVHQLIEARALATPAAIAVQYGEEMLSYEALDRRANQLANVLRERIGPEKTGRRVGVSVDRSINMLVALLAVLKAGCAYVPLDPMHPAARLRFILDEADVAALISDGSEQATLVGSHVPVINVLREAAQLADAPVTAPAAVVTKAAAATAAAAAPGAAAVPAPESGAESLAYVIYTSGSTGHPKGVEVSHRAVVNLLVAMARSPGLTRDDVFFAVTTIAFDIAGLELFLPLIVGAKVVIAERDAVIDGFKLLQQLKSVGATVMQATPASWRLLLEAGFSAAPSFKMWCGGEALPRELANRLLQSPGELWNMYGPTETTIWSSCTRVQGGDAAITVGGPTANTQFYVLDHNDQPLPVGVPGQLHIGGDGVARGYYKRPALTAEKFVNNPFAAGRMYRTGDLARWLPDGSLQVLGRIDHQIKLRGFRIELGEIEAVLLKKTGVSAAAVILREDAPGSPRIVAYYAAPPSAARSPDELRGLLAEDMPEYMIPSAWVRLDALPLSPNGKLDRAGLPLPDATQVVQEEFVAATSATETALTKIFAEVLNLERVGATADLLKLGADSIQLFQITARANRGGIRITAKDLLQHRNAAVLAALADAVSAEPPNAGTAAPLPTLGQFKRSRRTG